MPRNVELRFLARTAAKALGHATLRKPNAVFPRPHLELGFFDRLGGKRKNARVRIDYAKALVRFVAKRYGITFPRIAIRFRALHGQAGLIRSDGRTCYIDISEDIRDDDHRLCAVIAHELAHYVLAVRGVRLNPEWRNEELTDATAVMAGFGWVMINAAVRKQTHFVAGGWVESTSTVGYLSRKDLNKLVKLRGGIAKDRPPVRWAPVTAGALVGCWICAADLKSPLVTGRLRMRCPICTGTQVVTSVVPQSSTKLMGLRVTADRVRGLM